MFIEASSRVDSINRPQLLLIRGHHDESLSWLLKENCMYKWNYKKKGEEESTEIGNKREKTS